MRLDGSSRPPSTHVEWSCIWKACRLRSQKKERGKVFFVRLPTGKGGLPGDSELASTWLISVFDMLRCPSWLCRVSQVGVGGRESGSFVGGDGEGRGVMMFGRAELVGRVPPCQKYFPGGPCRACVWVDAGLPGRYLGNKRTGELRVKKNQVSFETKTEARKNEESTQTEVR